MFRTTAALLILSVAAVGCKKDGEGDGTTAPVEEGSGLGRFHGAWLGTADRSDGQSFPSECRFNYRQDTDEVVGQIDLDAFWDIVITVGPGGSYVLDGLPVVEGNPSTMLWTDLEFLDEEYKSFKANWLWEYADGQYQGTAEYNWYDINAQ